MDVEPRGRLVAFLNCLPLRSRDARTAQEPHVPPPRPSTSNPYPFCTCNPSNEFAVTSFDSGTPTAVVQRFRFRCWPATRRSLPLLPAGARHGKTSLLSATIASSCALPTLRPLPPLLASRCSTPFSSLLADRSALQYDKLHEPAVDCRIIVEVVVDCSFDSVDGS